MMKKVLMVTLALLALSMLISQGLARVSFFGPSGFYYEPSGFRRIRPIVSTDWLEGNLDLENLVILDVRSSDDYNAGHIPGAINVPEAEWYINDPFVVPLTVPWIEFPPVDDLFKLIGDAGITRYSLVVVVGATGGFIPFEAFYGTAGITRVAITLLYAGVENVAILDGGHHKWVSDGKLTDPVPVTPTPVTYGGGVDKNMLASAKYVERKIGESIIVDARDEIIYNGTDTEFWAPVPGHIPTAENLPTPTLWNVEIDEETGLAIYITYKDFWTLWTMASSVVGWNWFKEIIVYCGVGGYASTAYFVLSEVLGYRNVRIYDGSAQEWYLLGNDFEV